MHLCIFAVSVFDYRHSKHFLFQQAEYIYIVFVYNIVYFSESVDAGVQQDYLLLSRPYLQMQYAGVCAGNCYADFLQYIAEDGLFDEQFLFVFLPVCYLVLIAGTQLFHRLGHNRVGKYTTRILLVGTKEKYEKYLYYVNKTNTRISVVGYLEESALVGLTEAERGRVF